MLKYSTASGLAGLSTVSVLFNEPKLLKCVVLPAAFAYFTCFSALQRAEIAEISRPGMVRRLRCTCVSVLFNEPKLLKSCSIPRFGAVVKVSVLFNEPKLLKSNRRRKMAIQVWQGFSALQRAEIAEMDNNFSAFGAVEKFQCSSTSRNC